MTSQPTRATTFNSTLSALISRFERKTRSNVDAANLDRLKKRLILLKSTLGADEPLKLAAPIFTEFAELILEDDAAKRDHFFLTFDVRAEYVKRRGSVKQDDECVFSLISSIRAHYTAASVAEREAVVDEVKVLLTCCLEHQLETS